MQAEQWRRFSLYRADPLKQWKLPLVRRALLDYPGKNPEFAQALVPLIVGQACQVIQQPGYILG